MKTPTWIRAAALIGAAATSFALLQSVTLLAKPPQGEPPLVAQAASSAPLR